MTLCNSCPVYPWRNLFWRNVVLNLVPRPQPETEVTVCWSDVLANKTEFQKKSQNLKLSLHKTWLFHVLLVTLQKGIWKWLFTSKIKNFLPHTMLFESSKTIGQDFWDYSLSWYICTYVHWPLSTKQRVHLDLWKQNSRLFPRLLPQYSTPNTGPIDWNCSLHLGCPRLWWLIFLEE